MNIRIGKKKYHVVEYGKLWTVGSLAAAVLVGAGLWGWATLTVALLG